jgi:hypothetical protein
MENTVKKIYPIVGLLLGLLIFGLGCSTTTSYSKLGQAPDGYTTHAAEGITLQLSYLDQRSLYKLYSQKNNPFMNTNEGRLIVIEAILQSDTPVSLDVANAVLTSPGGARGPIAKESLYSYWYDRLKKNYSSSQNRRRGKSQYSSWSLKVTTELIEDTVLPGQATAAAGSEAGGYILFPQVRGEKKVDATLTLPVNDQSGARVHTFDFTFPL